MKITSGLIPHAKKVLIYGVEGIGKSTFASQFPNPVFIDTEGSTKNMDVARFEKPGSWQMLLEQVKYVIANPSVCQTLVIDTVDWAESMCIEAVCAKHQKNGLEGFAYGSGYVYVREEFGRFLNLLEEVIERNVNVVLTAHAQIKKFEQPDEAGAYDRWELKLGKKTGSQTSPLVREFCDMVLFANYETFVIKGKNEMEKNKATGGRRVMYTTHHPCWDAKNRFGLPDKLPFEFAQISHCFTVGAAASAPTYCATHQEHPQVNTSASDKQKVNPEMPLSVTASMPQTKTPTADASSVPPALAQLMNQYQVTEEQIRKIVAQRGYYPENTPIKNYDPNFISGVLVGAWQQVYEMIKENN